MKRSLPIGLAVSSFIALAPAHAIKGTYLPDSELSKSACKIKVAKVLTKYTPSLQNGAPTGERPFVDTLENVSMCSSTLIASDTILTAAHCFQGNNEQAIYKGTFKYPKMDADGKLAPGCDAHTWGKQEECVAGAVFGTIQSKWVGVELECPTMDGRTESRPLLESMGYPNPLFRTDAAREDITTKNYDVAVWRVERPFEHTPIMPVEYDWNRILANLKGGKSRSCKTFGYGLDNEGKSGTLRGALTPITAATERLLISDLAPTDEGPFIGGGQTDHGDSGGTLACEDADGQLKLYGIVSRGDENIAPMSEYRTDISIYSMPSFNAGWIEHVLKDGPLKRDLSTQWWYGFTVAYHQQAMENVLRRTKACIDENRREMGRDVYKHFYLPTYQDLENQYIAAQKEAQQYSDGAGLLRSKLRKLIDQANALLIDCQARAF